MKDTYYSRLIKTGFVVGRFCAKILAARISLQLGSRNVNSNLGSSPKQHTSVWLCFRSKDQRWFFCAMSANFRLHGGEQFGFQLVDKRALNFEGNPFQPLLFLQQDGREVSNTRTVELKPNINAKRPIHRAIEFPNRPDHKLLCLFSFQNFRAPTNLAT